MPRAPMRLQTIRRLCGRPGKAQAAEARVSLTSAERATVRAKTAGTCHVCGGRVGRRWQADHVVPHRLGGKAALENYLPICGECNRLRWFHAPEVIRLIMRLGVYAKNEIRHDTELGGALVLLLRTRLRGNRKRRDSRSAAG
jgi:5-methylcytosine-specific restriction endonuclease McrA